MSYGIMQTLPEYFLNELKRINLFFTFINHYPLQSVFNSMLFYNALWGSLQSLTGMH